MAFTLKRGQSPHKGVLEALGKQLANAAAELRAPARQEKAVHSARKRVKRARAALRLLRNSLGNKRYRRENQALRDAARPLTEIRDAEALIEALDKLRAAFARVAERRAFARVRARLHANLRTTRQRVLQHGDVFDRTARLVGEVRARARRFKVKQRGWAVIGPGLRRVYEEGRAALAAAARKRSSEALHEWRKQAKYLANELTLLAPSEPTVAKALAADAERLSALLGDDHDLSMLSQKLAQDALPAREERQREAMQRLIDQRRRHLEKEALRLGRKLYTAAPDAFARQMKDHWQASP